MDQGGRVIADQGVAAATAIGGPALGNRADLLRRDQTALCPAMSRLPAPLPDGGGGGGLALEPDGIGRRGLGGVGGIELQPSLEIADALLQLEDLRIDGVQDGQDGDLGFRWDGVPEWFRDGRPRDHTSDITNLLPIRFGPCTGTGS